MKFVEFNAIHKKNIKSKFLHVRITKIIKFQKLFARITTKKTKLLKFKYSTHNHEKFGIHRIPRHNSENHENLCVVQR